MAIYHFNVQIIGRSEGRSAIAAAAYRAGEKIVNELTGEIHDYTRKGDVDYVEILTPEGAGEWAQDKARLWNAAEQSEKRVNSQIAREINVALPIELTPEQNRALVRDYIQRNFINQGMVADLCIHNEKGENPHAHIMLSMREAGPEGFTKKNRSWNDKGQLENWREDWAHSCNKAMQRVGRDIQIDHRTLEAQGIDREPTTHLGPSATAMERRGIRTRPGDLNREISSLEETKKEVQQINSDLTAGEYEIRIKKAEKAGLEARKAARKSAQGTKTRKPDKTPPERTPSPLFEAYKAEAAEIREARKGELEKLKAARSEAIQDANATRAAAVDNPGGLIPRPIMALIRMLAALQKDLAVLTAQKEYNNARGKLPQTRSFADWTQAKAAQGDKAAIAAVVQRKAREEAKAIVPKIIASYSLSERQIKIATAIYAKALVGRQDALDKTLDYLSLEEAKTAVSAILADGGKKRSAKVTKNAAYVWREAIYSGSSRFAADHQVKEFLRRQEIKPHITAIREIGRIALGIPAGELDEAQGKAISKWAKPYRDAIYKADAEDFKAIARDQVKQARADARQAERQARAEAERQAKAEAERQRREADFGLTQDSTQADARALFVSRMEQTYPGWNAREALLQRVPAEYNPRTMPKLSAWIRHGSDRDEIMKSVHELQENAYKAHFAAQEKAEDLSNTWNPFKRGKLKEELGLLNETRASTLTWHQEVLDYFGGQKTLDAWKEQKKIGQTFEASPEFAAWERITAPRRDAEDRERRKREIEARWEENRRQREQQHQSQPQAKPKSRGR